ncbi:SPOR domain-containing protein [Stutzerimonas azotifigens]|uniref:SPOR domain-containing protein n=1 Tax=Stutzerimonas azotifigens TaxID=291995 RepID=UPI0005BAEA3A|nr:SPOR domain-containing protein [Stutzerimonas azotifigens]
MLDRGLKQRIVGALVLVALAVIFVPMLFNRGNDLRHVSVEAPPMPEMPATPDIQVQPVEVPEPEPEPALEPEPELEPLPDEPLTADAPPPVRAPDRPIEAPAQPAQPIQPAPAPAPAPAPEPERRLDRNDLPVSWSVQLASLSSRENAEALQATLRKQGYNAYIRSVDGMNRVFVGPLVERSEADRLRDQLQKQQKLNGFVVRFKPEAG